MRRDRDILERERGRHSDRVRERKRGRDKDSEIDERCEESDRRMRG